MFIYFVTLSELQFLNDKLEHMHAFVSMHTHVCMCVRVYKCVNLIRTLLEPTSESFLAEELPTEPLQHPRSLN